MAEAGKEGGAPPAIDYNAVYGTLSAENKDVFTRKGFDKAGGEGKPIDINGVFDWARNAEKLVGVDHIPSPRLDDDKLFNEWPGWEKLGVPKDTKEYKLDRAGLGVKEGQAYDEAAENVLRVAFGKAKIGQKQAEILYKELGAHRMGELTAMQTQIATARAEMETELRTTFGASYDARVRRANMALSYIAKEAKVDVADVIDGLAAGLKGNSASIKVLDWIGAQLGEDKIKGGGESGFQSGPAAAKAEQERLRGDAEFQKAYTTKTHPGHKAAVERMARLAEQAEGA